MDEKFTCQCYDSFVLEETKWRLIENKWQNIFRDFSFTNDKKIQHDEKCYSGVLADYLFLLHADISEGIKYCIYENAYYSVKFRRSGNLIHIYVTPVVKL